MIQTAQQAILSGLAEICELSEDIRFGQVMDFLAFLANERLAEIDDEQLLRTIEEHRGDLLRRRSLASEPRS